MPPWTGMMWPSRLVPTPNGVTGIRRSFAIASTCDTSAVEEG